MKELLRIEAARYKLSKNERESEGENSPGTIGLRNLWGELQKKSSFRRKSLRLDPYRKLLNVGKHPVAGLVVTSVYSKRGTNRFNIASDQGQNSNIPFDQN